MKFETIFDLLEFVAFVQYFVIKSVDLQAVNMFGSLLLMADAVSNAFSKIDEIWCELSPLSV